MSSLASMSDPQELSFALLDTIPAKTYGTIDDYKCNIFSLSMNEFQKGKENNETWNEYGDNGRGVGIVFTFPEENFEKWHQHYLSKIRYNEKEINKLKDFHKRHKVFAKRTDVEINGQVRNFLLPLAAFHKTKDYKKENEVRFLVINKDAFLENETSQYEPIINVDTQHNNSNSYIELELNNNRFVENAINVFKSDPGFAKKAAEQRPIPKIEKIILGPKLIETVKLKAELNKLAIENLGYKIKVEKSTLVL